MALGASGGSSSGIPATIPLITDVPSFYSNGPSQVTAYANGAFNSAQSYIVQLGNASAGLAPPVINPEFPTVEAPPTAMTVAPPTFNDVVWVAPAMPAAFSGELDVNDLFFDTFDTVAPTLVFPEAPDFNETAPDAPPVDTSFTMPTLTVNLPAKPDLLAISISPFGGMNFPTLDATAPTLDLVAPSIREYTPGAQYTSELLTTLKTSLQDRIINGGTGLGQDAETAIWDRGREREYRTAADALLEIDKMEAMGYMLPPGAFTDARIKVATETDYAARGHSREVMIESARLELDQVKHSLTTAVQLEQQNMSYANQVEQRLFDATKYATEAGVAIYNAGVQAFAARMEGYKGAIQAYTARIQAETAKVEAYKAEVEAETAKAQVNRALVDQYQAEITAALSAVEIFKAQVEAIQVRAQIEKTKIDIYGAQVQAFSAKVGAYTAGVEGYRARIMGESAKQESYKYAVEAFSAKIVAQAKQVDARIAVFQGQLGAYTAQWDGFKSAAQAEAARVSALASVDSATADVYRSTVQGISSFNDTLTKQWQAVLDENIQIANVGVAAAKANAELYMSTRSLAMDSAKVGAQVSAQLGAAALGVLNFSSSFSESRSDSNSNSLAHSESKSDNYNSANSTSTSTSTNYNYSV